MPSTSSGAAASPPSTSSATAGAAPADESLVQHVKRSSANCWASTMACSSNAKETALIKKLEFDIASRKKKFGFDYLTMKEQGKSDEDLKACLDQAIAEIEALKQQIAERENQIGVNKVQLRETIAANAAATSTPNAPGGVEEPSTSAGSTIAPVQIGSTSAAAATTPVPSAAATPVQTGTSAATASPVPATSTVPAQTGISAAAPVPSAAATAPPASAPPEA